MKASYEIMQNQGKFNVLKPTPRLIKLMTRYKRIHLGDYVDIQLCRVLRALEREDEPLLSAVWQFS